MNLNRSLFFALSAITLCSAAAAYAAQEAPAEEVVVASQSRCPRMRKKTVVYECSICHGVFFDSLGKLKEHKETCHATLSKGIYDDDEVYEPTKTTREHERPGRRRRSRP